MVDVKQCKTCWWWRNSEGNHGSTMSHFCHHLLFTGKRRVEVDGECKSYKPIKKLNKRKGGARE